MMVAIEVNCDVLILQGLMLLKMIGACFYNRDRSTMCVYSITHVMAAIT